jgi:hypothetical protein
VIEKTIGMKAAEILRLKQVGTNAVLSSKYIEPPCYVPVPKPTSNEAKYRDSYFFCDVQLLFIFRREKCVVLSVIQRIVNNIFVRIRTKYVLVIFNIFLVRVSKIISQAA